MHDIKLNARGTVLFSIIEEHVILDGKHIAEIIPAAVFHQWRNPAVVLAHCNGGFSADSPDFRIASYKVPLGRELSNLFPSKSVFKDGNLSGDKVAFLGICTQRSIVRPLGSTVVAEFAGVSGMPALRVGACPGTRLCLACRRSVNIIVVFVVRILVFVLLAAQETSDTVKHFVNCLVNGFLGLVLSLVLYGFSDFLEEALGVSPGCHKHQHRDN